MSSDKTWRDWARLIYYLGQNPLSLIGVILTTSSAITLIAFWIYDFLLPGPPHPYIGILLFLLLPGIFALGLILIPMGILIRRRNLQAARELPSTFPTVDFNSRMVRNTLLFIGAATLANVMIFAFASYKGVSYMDSTAFCGQTCHTVMQPEYTAYQGSPHSHVECVECHIGPGAQSFVKAKLSGLRQVYGVTFNRYSRPIPAPVKYLRPAKDTCENCHWRGRYLGNKLFVKTEYKEDATNTPLSTVLLLKIGGQTGQGPVGIHGHHLESGSNIEYITTDGKREVIPAVFYTNGQGKTVEYVSTDSKPSKEELQKGERRRMDCMDCHNRPTHAFELPENAVNLRIKSGLISPELPFVRKEALELVKASYPDRDTAKAKIIEGMTDYYRSHYPELYAQKRTLIEQAASTTADIYLRNIFPEMNVTWGVHPNQLGHNDFPGCFRCHDGSHTSADGQTIGNDCTLCHEMLAMQEEKPKVLADIGMQ